MEVIVPFIRIISPPSPEHTNTMARISEIRQETIKVRSRGVSPEAQTRTNEAEITVL